MKRQKLYIGISIVVIALIFGLIGWAIFVGKQQQNLQQGAEDLGYTSNSPGTKSGGGLFGKIFDDTQEGATPTEPDGPEPILRQLYNLPTAGFIKMRANSVRFVDRATGHVFEKDLQGGASTRINQTTVPKVYNSIFLEDGDVVVRQYIGENESLISIYSDISEEEVENTQIPYEIIGWATNREGKEIVILEETSSGSKVSILNLKDTSKKEILDSLLSGWTLQWEGGNLLINQKASEKIPGSAYLISKDTNEKTLVLQQLPGLTTNLSPDGSSVLYSNISTKGLPSLYVKNIDTNNILSLNISGFSEKCVWHPNKPKVYCALPEEFPKEHYPDAWYQGSASFSDSIWEIDTKTSIVTHIISPKKSNGVTLDAVNMAIDIKGENIFFINKSDQTFWSLEIPNDNDESTE